MCINIQKKVFVVRAASCNQTFQTLLSIILMQRNLLVISRKGDRVYIHLGNMPCKHSFSVTNLLKYVVMQMKIFSPFLHIFVDLVIYQSLT